MPPLITALTVFFSLIASAVSETHTITFDNRCGHGVPTLIQGSNVLSTGQSYTHNGAFSSAIAYLNNSMCGFNGEHCSLLEMTLGNSGTSADISLIPSHNFSDPIGWEYTGACNGNGAFCSENNCNTAFYKSDDTCVQVACTGDNAGMNIIFCEGGSSRFNRPDGSQQGVPCPP
ncbi:hypothetical protein DFH11DRAFT_1501201 [Phellopilus nigrolimitatus]|nr:hypothetical protein DFH11DRAFT_1501201 [Phellopilus nigrolimitatus]